MSERRPHIIIFNPDEMRWDTMGHMGNPAAATPYLDGFARSEAVSFDSAFCQNPVCVPSRCSFFTGLYPHVNGHRTMQHLLHPGEEDMFSELRAAGYHVWMNARNDLYAGEIPGWAESHADTIWYGGTPGPRGREKRAGWAGEHEDLYSHYEGRILPDGNKIGDQQDVEAAVEFLESFRGERPLCVFLGLMYPHVPYEAEDPWYSAIDRHKLPPRIVPEDCRGKSKMLELLRKYQGLDILSREDWDELRSVYLAMCSRVDDMFRLLCDGLRRAGIYDECAIFFLSDHGDFAGDYGVTEKAQSTYEDVLTRVPLLIKPPKGEALDPGVTHSLAELVDFYATVMDYAGVRPRRTHFGRSLRPIVENRSREVRDFVCCEGGRLPEEVHCDEFHASGPNGPAPGFVYYPKMLAQTDSEAHAKGVMLRTKRYKLVRRITGEDEIYDLETDPGERVNRINDPALAGELAKLQDKLTRWLLATSDVVPWEHDRRFTDEMLWNRVKALCPPEREAEVREKIKDGIPMGRLLQELRAGTQNNFDRPCLGG